MKAFTVKQAQTIDRWAIQGLGIPSHVLMENAGRLTADEIVKLLKVPEGNFICVLCGTGNNGGDGFVVARHLLASGFQVKVLLLGDVQRLKSDPRMNYDRFRKLSGTVTRVKSAGAKLSQEIRRATLIVDAVFGIGLNRALDRPFPEIFRVVNQSRKTVVAVDVPSGLDATTGKVLGACIRANLTVTFAVMKKGFLKKDGARYAGRVVVVDIGTPKALERKA